VVCGTPSTTAASVTASVTASSAPPFREFLSILPGVAAYTAVPDSLAPVCVRKSDIFRPCFAFLAAFLHSRDIEGFSVSERHQEAEVSTAKRAMKDVEGRGGGGQKVLPARSERDERRLKRNRQ